MSKPALMLGLGAAALLLMRKGSGSRGIECEGEASLPGCAPAPEPEVAELEKWLSPAGKPQVGFLYQVVEGDDPLVVARKALFGSQDPRVDAAERQAVIDLSIRIDCGPWNQTVNSRPRGELGAGHHAVDKGYTQKGIRYAPVFPDNAKRLAEGNSPLVGTGGSYPLIWVPRIDLDKFSKTFEVTTLGQDWPDDGDGEYSMIDPPSWVINLDFEGEIEAQFVGCHLPEGNFRRKLESGE